VHSSLFRRNSDIQFRLESLEDLSKWLQTVGWLEPHERLLDIAPAGAANMNCARRLRTDRRSVILKHGRPWVEKSPHIPAPVERTLAEAIFYQTVRDVPAVAGRMPRMLGYDHGANMLMLEDCGAAADFTHLYVRGTLNPRTADQLVDYLSALHAIPVSYGTRLTLRNDAMRRSNHERIFRLPLDPDNGLHMDAITPGLSAIARRVTRDRRYVTRVMELGRMYVEDEGPVLVHGDFFPGSWLVTSAGPCIIDPEFAFIGPAEVDLGGAAGAPSHRTIARRCRRWGSQAGRARGRCAGSGCARAEGESDGVPGCRQGTPSGCERGARPNRRNPCRWRRRVGSAATKVS
jgi:5-methylthioribose kinase